MKTSKRFLALMLSALMIFSVVFIPGADLSSLFSIEAEAYTNTTIGRITQQQVVGTQTSIDGVKARDFWYTVYAGDYFDGHSEPTNIVIPGLGDGDDYTPQGMTYWEAKNWILISAYDAGGSDPSCIYAVDVATGKFVALFNIRNADGSVNTSHGGGIAASEYNFYFADSASNISYIPLSEMDVAEGTEKDIKIKGTISFSGEMNGANTSYCCYDDGVLWVGNFFLSSENSYKQPANASSNSMLLGYRLAGDSSEEEWDYLCGQYKNMIQFSTTSGTVSKAATMTWNAYRNGDSVDIVGNISGAVDNDTYIAEFATVNFPTDTYYTIEYDSTNADTEIYLSNYAATPFGKTLSDLGNGRYHHQLNIAIQGQWTVQFGQPNNSQANQNFVISNLRIHRASENLVKLNHTAQDNNNLKYSIVWNTNDTYTISGSVTNGASGSEITSNFANASFIEGQSYTISFRSKNPNTEIYLFSPKGPHIRVCDQYKCEKLNDGTYFTIQKLLQLV